MRIKVIFTDFCLHLLWIVSESIHMYFKKISTKIWTVEMLLIKLIGNPWNHNRKPWLEHHVKVCRQERYKSNFLEDKKKYFLMKFR